MKSYMFYTFEGKTQSPTGDEIENLQILGFESGDSIEEAKKILLDKNKWITLSGFDKDKIESKQLLNKKLKELIELIVSYNWEDEQRHYEECLDENHIFLKLKEIKSLID